MLKKIARIITKVVISFLILSVLSVILYRFVPVPVTPLMLTRSVENGFQKWKHRWVPIEEISPNLQVAVVASEDQNFLKHNGFDFEAIKKAQEHNKKGKRIRGASTISQQVAKNVFLWQGRSWVRKGFEVYFTVLIEVFWSKQRIMEVYLNSIEMGDGVYGVEAASQHWYRKSAQKLNAREAAGIAAILPNPRKFKASNSSNYIENRKNNIMRQMRFMGVLKY
jgi:monofunctional biosynthetic peptidoglycan transglycosylase